MSGTAEELARAGQLWPGNQFVDWISWDVYNASGCRRGAINPARYVGFEESMRVFFDWLQSTGPSRGIDLSKPVMISEAGSVVYPGKLDRTAAWYRQIPRFSRSTRRSRLLGFGTTPDSDHATTGSRGNLRWRASVREAGTDRLVRPPGSGSAARDRRVRSAGKGEPPR